jgi:hypothetical protein
MPMFDYFSRSTPISQGIFGYAKKYGGIFYPQVFIEVEHWDFRCYRKAG